jgi:ribonuclease-3
VAVTANEDRPGLVAKLAEAERILGHRFSDQTLLRQAITHPSAVNNAALESFERLEFLGDSVISVTVAEEIYRRFPEMSEGGMTRIRISLVAGAVMAAVAQEAGLEDVIVLGESELRSGRRGRVSALEDVYEALTAALYLDAGRDAARAWVMRTLGPLISEEVAATPANPKSVLQERVQTCGDSPTYKIIEQVGPPHERTFTAVVEIGGTVVGEGSGRSKREAETAAAAAALEAMIE